MSGAHDTPEHSPEFLAPPPSRGKGVRRLNRLPIVFAVGAVMLVVAAIGYTYHDRLVRLGAKAQQSSSHRPEPASSSAVLSNAPVGSEVEPAVTTKPISEDPGRLPTQSVQRLAPKPSDGDSDQMPGDDEATKARHEAWQSYYEELAELRKQHLTAATSAMTASTALNESQGARQFAGNAGTASTPMAGGLAAASTGAGPDQPAQDSSGVYPSGFGLPIYPPARVDANAQREKQAFLNQPGDVIGTSDELPAMLRDPSSPYLIMAGTAIPAMMVGGINSDLPGMMIGQVAENLYDTATGRFLLIPQGSRLIGSYDNMVSNGQTRVGVIWNRIIFPDAESIDLGAMEGADQGGYAGLHDQVDTHFWAKIGNALLISIAGAGVQLSQPQAPVNGQFSAQQIAAASLGQQFGELGQEYARAGLSIPNTLEIRPGYRFVAMVNKDMHLRPYADRRATGGTTPASLGPLVQ